MKISTIETGFLKLDGGAMFGIVPKRLWQKLNPPDENNLCTWAMRCLLVETDNRKILIDTGIGDKQDAKFRSHFEPHGDKTLLNSLLEKNLHPEDITDVLLTHLHFDHVGGAVKFDSEGKLVPTFPNATYWSNEIHWNWAMQPNEREKASFLKENFVPLREAGVVQFIDIQEEDMEWLPGIHLRFVYGHTEAMMIPIIKIANKTLIYCADVMPSSYHIGMPYVMSYDVRPLVTLVEKEKILYEAVTNKNILLFEHDPFIAAATVTQDDRGRIVLEKTFNNLEQALLSM
ncbi:MAG: MBL fold metallo-hydrolase [Saprospiraceae bacterium]|nr:MBL fold metallo-hydrolase [Saprospiraceae bacterium]